MKTFIALITLMSSLTVYAACSGDVENHPMIDPVDGNPFNVTAKAYRPDIKNAPVVFILPTIIAESVVERRLASRFCKNGIAAFILDVVKDLTPAQELPDLNVHDQSYVRALAGVRTVMANLKADSSLSQTYGIMGLSLGGIQASFIAGSEPLIKASVIVVGAGNVPGILAYSDQKIVAKQRDERLKYFNLSDQKAYEETLKPLIPHDPINVAINVLPGSMYMFIALNDKTVPTKYQQELRAKIAEPLVYEIKTNHVGAVIKAGSVHAGKVTKFFLRKLGE